MVVGISMVRDEVDIVGHTVGHMLEEVDHVLVADNGSTDGTRERLEELPVTLVDDPEPAYYQSRKMTALAARAAELGAEWVVPFDADEWWYSPKGRIADVLGEIDEAVVVAELYDHVATAQDPDEANPIERLGWRRRLPAPLHKVACRPIVSVQIEQGNHAATYPEHHEYMPLTVRHFSHRSVEQFVRKVKNGAAAYAATDLPYELGAHWRDWGAILEANGEDAVAGIFREWYWSPAPDVDKNLIFDPCPS